MHASVLWSWLHFVSLFVLFAALVAEHLLFRPPLDVATAKRIGVLDAIYGSAAVAVLLTGLARMAAEKGYAWYLQNGAFHALLGLYVAVGLLSIYPTMVFLRWRAQTRSGQAPALAETTARRVIMVLRLELLLILVIPFFAALMARG